MYKWKKGRSKGRRKKGGRMGKKRVISEGEK